MGGAAAQTEGTSRNQASQTVSGGRDATSQTKVATCESASSQTEDAWCNKSVNDMMDNTDSAADKLIGDDDFASDSSDDDVDDDDMYQDPDWHYSDFESSTDESDDDSVLISQFNTELRLTSETCNHTHERKFVVFESCLVKLFLVCFVCLAPCRVFMKSLIGGCVIIEQLCETGHTRVWSSQPFSGTLPLGNLLTAASIFLAALARFVPFMCFATFISLQ